MMSQIRILDKVLGWFYLNAKELPESSQLVPEPYEQAKKRALGRTAEAILKEYPELQTKEFILDYERILNKLLKDGYLLFEDKYAADNLPGFPELHDIQYSISFEGKLFYEQGGYETESNRKTISSRLQSIQTWAIALGGILGALGTIGLLLFEYLKYTRHGR
jgi:hypothetical protein